MFFFHVDSKNSDQTERMPRLIIVLAGCTGHFVGFAMIRLVCLPDKLDKFVAMEFDKTFAYRSIRYCRFKEW